MVARACCELSAQAREVLRMVGNQLAVVVELAEDHFVRRVHPRFSLHKPIASWPGRSEKEKSTVSPDVCTLTGTHDGTTNVSRGSNSKLSVPIGDAPAAFHH